MAGAAPYSERDLRAAIEQGCCWADALRFLGYEPKGHNYRTVKRWAAHWGIATSHFDPTVRTRRSGRSREVPLEEAMVAESRYERGALKRRLIRAGLKQPVCEMCGQGEIWHGRRMSMVLDHINGVSNDHRLENLRMLCPNCNATLDTHCGRNVPRSRVCRGCGRTFAPSSSRHRYCSDACWGTVASSRYTGVAQPSRRKVERPSYGHLISDLSRMSMVKVGRKYGVSDNAVRKWLRWYEADLARRVATALVDGVPREIVV